VLRPYDRHELALWVGWASAGVLGFAYLEWRGMQKRHDRTPTLTAVVSRYVPGWAAYAAFGAAEHWLGWHFDRAYASWQYGRPPDIPR